MRTFTLFSVLVLTCAAIAIGQNDKRTELFAGYSFENVNSGIATVDLPDVTSSTIDNRFSANGFNIAGTRYFTKRFGITGDFSAHYKTRDDVFDTVAAKSKLSLYNVTAGPQFRFSTASRFT